MKARRTKNTPLALRRLVARVPDLAKFEGRKFFLRRAFGDREFVHVAGHSDRRLEKLAARLNTYHGFSFAEIRAVIRWSPEEPRYPPRPLSPVLDSIITRDP